MNTQLLLKQICLLCTGLVFSISPSIAQTGYTEKENIEYVSEEVILNKLQELKKLRTTLPDRVDHSQSKYMSEVLDQGSMGSCGSASRISYMFAYEINNFRDLDGKNPINKYPSHFTWLLTGQNSEKENMAIFNGIPNALTYGTSSSGNSKYQYNPIYGGYVSWPDKYPQYGWMNGYDKWRSAMDNRLEKTSNIKMNTDEAIEYVKWWIYNHHGDDDFNEGGVAGAGAATAGWVTKNIPTGSYKSGELIVTSYGKTIDHGVTWVGYDDKIEYDLNGNGKIDDDEKGALIMLNSWGNWGNKGCVYVPYKIVKSYGGGLGAELYYIRKRYKPIDVFRIVMDYDQRCNIKISIGVSSNPEATTPEKTIVAEHFNYAGFDPIPLLGKYSGVINKKAMEFGLDLTDLISVGFDTREDFSYFLIIETKAAATGTGSVQELEVIRYPLGMEQKAPDVVGKIKEAQPISGGGKKIIIPIDVPSIKRFVLSHLYVPQKRLKVKKVSTQETIGEVASGGGGLGKHSIDNNPSTYWHSAWNSGTTPKYPHYIVFEIDSTYTLTGFEYLPRQNSANGRIGDYKFYVSNSPNEDGELVAEGTFENNKNTKRAFFEPIKGKYVKLMNYKAANGDNNTCMAEFNLFYSVETKDPGTSIDDIDVTNLNIRQNGTSLYVSGIENEAVFSLYNLQGQKVLETTAIVISANTETELNIATLPKGVYILNVVLSNGTKTEKVFLE